MVDWDVVEGMRSEDVVDRDVIEGMRSEGSRCWGGGRGGFQHPFYVLIILGGESSSFWGKRERERD